MKKLTTALFILLFVAGTGYSQVLKIGLGGGYTTFNGADYFVNDISENGLGFSDGYHYGGVVKVGLPMIPLKFVGTLYYTGMGETGDQTDPEIVANNEAIRVETDGSIMTIGIGAEWSLVPGPVSPYIAFDVLINSFGETDITRAGDMLSAEYQAESMTRYGIGIGAGFELTLLPKVDVDVNLKYKMHNLIGKDDQSDLASFMPGVESEEKNINSINVTINFLFNVL